jgi:hypothetical protein
VVSLSPPRDDSDLVQASKRLNVHALDYDGLRGVPRTAGLCQFQRIRKLAPRPSAALYALAGITLIDPAGGCQGWSRTVGFNGRSESILHPDRGR